MKKYLQLSMIAAIAFAGCQEPKTESGDTSNGSDTTETEAPSAVYSMASAACDNSRRYEGEGELGGGAGLSQLDAMRAIEAYRERNSNSITGFHLSKKALDSLFSIYNEANGIWIDLVNPRDIPKLSSQDTLGVIVSVRNNPHYELKFVSGDAAYISESECPTMCARF